MEYFTTNVVETEAPSTFKNRKIDSKSGENTESLALSTVHTGDFVSEGSNQT